MRRVHVNRREPFRACYHQGLPEPLALASDQRDGERLFSWGSVWWEEEREARQKNVESYEKDNSDGDSYDDGDSRGDEGGTCA